MKRYIRSNTQIGASTLEYLLASAVLFFCAVAMLHLVNDTATSYFGAASFANGGQTGLAPCGVHSSLVNDECY